MKTNKILLAAIGVALAIAAVNANAGTAINTLTPSLTINGLCTVGIAGSNVFPAQTYGATGALDSAVSTVTATCPGTPYELTADAGLNSVAGARHLGSTTGIAYTLDVAAGTGTGTTTNADWGTTGHTKPLGSGAVATAASATMINVTTPDATADTFLVTAKIAALTGAEVIGTYSDTVIVTASW